MMKGIGKNKKHGELSAGPNFARALIYNLCELVFESFRKIHLKGKVKMHFLQKGIGILRHNFSTHFFIITIKKILCQC